MTKTISTLYETSDPDLCPDNMVQGHDTDQERTSYFSRLSALPFRDPSPPRTILASLLLVTQRRYLLYQFVRRELSLRYKQTLLGIGWAVFQPLAAMFLFAIVFGRFLKVDSEGSPYIVFVLAGLVPWTFFASGLMVGSQAVVSASGLVGKVPFPLELLPIAGVVVACVDFLINGTILFCLLLFFDRPITAWYGLIPLLLLMQLAFSLSLSFVFSALNVQYRDVRYVLPFLLPLLMYAMPIGYSFDAIPREWVWTVVLLNPMAPIIDSYRKILLIGSSPNWQFLTAALIQIVIMLFVGYKFFKTRERAFADVI